MHQFKTEQYLPIAQSKAWEFFSSPQNLSLITPPEMDFRILTSLKTAEIFEGMKIDYTVKPLWDITVHWQTEIIKVEYQKCFIDRQTKGPYKKWEHTHTFTVANGGVLMKDEVNYQLPLGAFGKYLNAVLIRKKIESIFSYRKKVLEKIFR